MSASQVDIRKTFDAELLKLLPEMGLDKNDIAWPNARFVPDPKRTYLRCFLMPGQSIQASLGSDFFTRLVGVYQISIFTPKDTGILEAEKIVEILLKNFPLGLALQCCGESLILQSVYNSPAMEDEDRYHVPVSLSYYCYSPRKR